jgi:hypothetical protein
MSTAAEAPAPVIALIRGGPTPTELTAVVAALLAAEAELA